MSQTTNKIENRMLLVGILPRNQGDRFVQSAKKIGAGGGTVIMGRGNSQNTVLQLLGLADVAHEIVYILVEEQKKAAIWQTLITETATEKTGYGVLFSVDITKFIKNGMVSESGKENTMAATSPYELITVILNKGFADDAMAAARKAGAGGGTIIYAHGTGREEDAKFFGITIVPEKEMLLILVDRGLTSAVVESIRTLPCLSEPGSGIAFSTDVGDFTLLGKKASQ